jgi:CRP/FNR family transcriptional regulator, anaerobic regulatory protein
MPSHSMSMLASGHPMPAPASPTVVSFRELKPRCATCSMGELCLPVGLEPDAMRQLDQVFSSRTLVKKRDSLYRIQRGE